MRLAMELKSTISFNPLDRVKFVQINNFTISTLEEIVDVSIPQIGSNLFKSLDDSLDDIVFDDVSIPQIGSNLFKYNGEAFIRFDCRKADGFQSPRSGQICSNERLELSNLKRLRKPFQSPRSGQICSNFKRKGGINMLEAILVSIPQIGSNLFK